MPVDNPTARDIWPWDESLTTGLRTIDEQHRQLFREANMLAIATIRNEGHRVLDQFMNYLGIYISEHFQTEEAFMDVYQYPRTAEHKDQHRRFAEEFGRLKLEASDMSMVAVLRVCARITQWMHLHIFRHDRDLAAFLRKTLWPDGLPQRG